MRLWAPLFVNVSIGGTLTHFAAPPVLMVARPWGWDTPFMLSHFGWRAGVAIVLSTTVYIWRLGENSLRLRGGRRWWMPNSQTKMLAARSCCRFRRG